MTIFNQALKRIFKSKTRVLLLLIMPVMFIIMFALQDQRSLTIGIVDKDGSMLSEKLTKSLTEMHKVKVLEIKEKEVYDKAISHQTDYTVIIEEGFEASLISAEAFKIKEFYPREKEKLFFARNFVENFLYNMKILAIGADFNQEKFNEAFAEYEKGKLAMVKEVGEENELIQARAAMGFLMQFMLYMSVITAGLISEDKNSGVFYRVFYAPVTLKRYMAENLMAFVMVGIIQLTLIMVLLKIVFGIRLGSNPIHMYLLFMAFSIVCISLGMWLVSLFKKPIGAYTSILLLTTPLVMLGGGYWPKEFMPDILQKIALFIPTSWLMNGVEKILYEGKGISGIFLEIIVLAIFSGIFLAAGLSKKVDISK